MPRASSYAVLLVVVIGAALLALVFRDELRAGSTKSPFQPGTTIPGLRERSCHDGIDNDADGFVDCDDPDCAVRKRCMSLGLSEFTLGNARAAFRFVRTSWDLALESVRSVDTGRRYPLVLGPLWTVTLRAPDGTKNVVTPGDYPASFTFDWRDNEPPGRSRSLRMYWTGIQVDASTTLDVTALFKLQDGAQFVHTRLFVSGDLGGSSIFETEFPRLDFEAIDDPGGNLLLYPSRKSGGGLIDDPEIHVGAQELTYPTNYQMGLAAYYGSTIEEGLYVACDDGNGWTKRFLLEGRDSSMFFGMKNVPPDNLTATSYVQPYRQKFGPFEGDWFDAAVIYRKFALAQSWVPERWETRSDIPEALRHQRLNLFIKSEIDHIPAEFVTLLEAYRDQFGLTSTIALFRGWDTTGDDTGRYPPDHFPPKPGFGATVAAAQAISGMTTFVVPGTGSIGYDPRTPSYASENAELAAYKDEQLQPRTRGVFVRMDSCTDYWRQKDHTIRIDTLQGQYGVDGSYFDSFVINGECYDPNHGHPIAGGTYMHDCIRENLASLLAAGRAVDPAYFLGEEPPTENFIDLFQFREGYFCVAPVGKEHELHVPLFQAVYHDVAPCLVSNKVRKASLDDGTYQPIHADLFQAHGFVIGNRLNVIEVITSATEGEAGWLLRRPELQTHFEYLARLTEASDYAKKYLAFGRMMRPLRADVPWVSTGLEETCDAMHRAPVVESSAWVASDGAIGLVFSNWTDEQRSIQYDFRLAEYDLDPNGSYMLSRLDASGSTPIGPVTGDFSRTEVMAPKSVLVLEIQ